MKAIVGLGNPGSEYENTRHNAGWHTLACLSDVLGANYWKEECGASVAHCKNTKYDEEILLVKPLSFMNLSGSPVKNICEKYKLALDDLIIIHDDMDITPGNIRVKCGGSSAGHNGLKSITQKLASEDYVRIRIGVGKPEGQRPVIDYVLSEPKGKLLQDFKDGCQLASEAALFLLENSLEDAQQKYNCKN